MHGPVDAATKDPRFQENGVVLLAALWEDL
jgi:hypothetical protein